jgi:hypothetical protein
MFTSYVIRLRTDRLALGELVGELEPVATGERVAFRDVGDLVNELRVHAHDHPWSDDDVRHLHAR